ncbi:MAG: small basic protein [Candidatus Omnitrophica bacterium]|nr:small basic protein [Candidatus Omnitrophota bacterium]MCM8799546.1 small basic protein [Candidatus Omnitrophota bacterium]
MSIHPSLKMSSKDKQTRSVLKRTERIKILLEKGQWQKSNSIYGLPKIKVFRMKIKKEKATAEQPQTGATESKPTEEINPTKS